MVEVTVAQLSGAGELMMRETVPPRAAPMAPVGRIVEVLGVTPQYPWVDVTVEQSSGAGVYTT